MTNVDKASGFIRGRDAVKFLDNGLRVKLFAKNLQNEYNILNEN
jgi:hypothetical protein